MDLHIADQLFIVGGASSGFGKSIATALLHEGAHVIAIARSQEKLAALPSSKKLETIATDITEPASVEQIKKLVANRQVHGMLLNAGGPPAKTVLETTADDWDHAYQQILKWKVLMTQAMVALMKPHQYGRLLFIESSSVKQPLENLVLSNSLRLAVIGFVKTLSHEISRSGITLNIMAPGSHDTAAIERIYRKKSEQAGISFEEAKKQGIQQIPVGKLGNPDDFASLACWLLSPLSGYINGETISVDGGAVKGVFG